MSQRKTLGTNLGPAGGGMMAAFGFTAAPRPEPVPPAAEAAAASTGAEELRSAAKPEPAAAPAAPARSLRPAPEAPAGAVAVARIATSVSVPVLDLAKRAAYWHRDTLRDFLERAIEAEARRIEKELGLDSLPEPQVPRRSRSGRRLPSPP